MIEQLEKENSSLRSLLNINHDFNSASQIEKLLAEREKEANEVVSSEIIDIEKHRAMINEASSTIKKNAEQRKLAALREQEDGGHFLSRRLQPGLLCRGRMETED